MYPELLQSLMAKYGLLVHCMGLFLGPLGLPIPTALMVLAAGAFTKNGLMNARTVIGLSLLASVLGDTAGYAIGRYAGGCLKLFGENRRFAVWQKAQERFRQSGGLTIFITRFLLAVLDVPTNYVAGSSGYVFHRFIAWDFAGRVTWILIYGGLGYLFDSQWQSLSRTISLAGIWLVGAAVMGFTLNHLFRFLRRHRSSQVFL